MQPIITIEHNDVLFPIPESALAGPPQKSDAEEHDQRGLIVVREVVDEEEGWRVDQEGEGGEGGE